MSRSLHPSPSVVSSGSLLNVLVWIWAVFLSPVPPLTKIGDEQKCKKSFVINPVKCAGSYFNFFEGNFEIFSPNLKYFLLYVIMCVCCSGTRVGSTLKLEMVLSPWIATLKIVDINDISPTHWILVRGGWRKNKTKNMIKQRRDVISIFVI